MVGCHNRAEPPSALMHPKIEPRRLGFGFLTPTPSPASRLRTRSPTTTTTSFPPPHHLPPSPSTAVWHGAPEIEPPRSVSWFLALQPPLPPRVCEHVAPPPPPPSHPHHPTTSSHHPPPPFSTAHPKSSHRAQFRVFYPSAISRLAFANAQPYHRHHLIRNSLPPPLITLHRRFTRRTRNQAITLALWLLAPAPSPTSRLRTRSPTTTITTSFTPPHHLPPLPSTAVSHGTPETKPRRLGFNIP